METRSGGTPLDAGVWARKIIPSRWMAYRVCVDTCPDDPNFFVAHCLELDLMGVGECVESALTELLENIDTQIEICARTKAQFLMPAPVEVWKSYKEALDAGRRVCDELVVRVLQQANKRLGHKPPTMDRILASKEVPAKFLGV